MSLQQTKPAKATHVNMRGRALLTERRHTIVLVRILTQARVVKVSVLAP